MMRNALTAILLAGLLLGAFGAAAQGAAKRVALVIGNGEYTTVGRLTNPANDAKAVAAMLKTCDFDVIMHADLDLEGMDKAVKAFSGKMSGAECALFFFAGHGLQKDGMNYLVPVTREPETEGEIRSRCLNAEEVLAAMERSGARVNIMMLDACRNNPLPKDNRYTVRGLANMEAPSGSLIAFATGPGKTASDGKGANSPFTESLLKYLPTPGVDVELVLKRVTDEVLQKTGEQQSPWRQSNLRNEFYFVPGSGGSSAPGPVAALPPAPPAAPSLVGHLQVAVNAPAARVQVDGAQKGMASPEKPLNLEGLLAGKVKVRVDAEGYDPLEKVVDIKVNDWAQESFILSRVIVIQPTEPRPPTVVTPTPPAPPAPAPSTSGAWGAGSRAGETRSVDLGGGVSLEMVWIPPGEFMMGGDQSPKEVSRLLGSEEWRKIIQDKLEDENPRHKVILKKGFWFGKYEVTQAQWQAVMGNNPSKCKGLNNPVEQVSWNNCQDFVQKLNARVSGGGFRLPTEPEWEYACRAGTTTPFHYGETIATDQANYDGNYTYGNGSKGVRRGKSTPVGTFPANAWGLHDMHGNVQETCQDIYNPYKSSKQETNPSVLFGKVHVSRGGSWADPPWNLRSAMRSVSDKEIKVFCLGFRIARSL